MKDFMLIFISQSYADLGLSPEEMQGRMGKWFAWNTKMTEQGIVKHGDALADPVRRVSGASRTITDRTRAEVKELVGGYYIISAKDLDEATKIAEDYPDYDLGGTVEIREIMVFDQ